MAGEPKELLRTLTIGAEEREEREEHEDRGEREDQREVFLRDGRRLVIGEVGTDQLVEVRNAGGMVEVRILLTEQGPVLQMEAVRLQLKASEAIELESPHVAIIGAETLALSGGKITVEGEQDVDIEAQGDVHVVGTKIYLN